MTEEEIKVQIILGTFSHDKITPDFICNCKNVNVLKLIAQLWVSIMKSLNTYITNDDITNALINHPQITSELRQYVIEGRLIQNLKNELQIKIKHYFNPHITSQLYEEKLTKLINMEKKLFGS